jgi:hypothetical protein
VAGIDPRYYYLTLGLLIICTVVSLFVAYRLQKDVNVDDVPPTEKELLGPLEKAYYSGLMTEDEFKRVNKSMAKQKNLYDESVDAPQPASKLKKPPMTMAEATEPATTDEPDTEEDPQP